MHQSKYIPYLILLCASKLCRSFGLFMAYDILKLLHIVQFLCIVKFGSAVVLVLLQKPFTSGRKISRRQWLRITRHALFGTCLNLMWLFGLTLCGPLRTLLLFEHSDMVIIAGASALFSSSSSPSKFRGAVFFLMAVMGLLFFDHDDAEHHIKENMEVHRKSHHNGLLSHLFDHLTNLTGLSDHKGGVVLLFVTLCLQVGFRSASKKLSVDIGGSKRLHTLSTVMSSLLLLPWATVLFYTKQSEVMLSSSMVVPLFLVIIFVFVADFYIEATSTNHLEISHTKRVGAMATFISAMMLSCVWNHPFVNQMTTMRYFKVIIAEDHVLSGGVVFSFVLFMFATQILTSQGRLGIKGSFIGYSAAGLPLYNFTSEKFTKTSNSVILVTKQTLKNILEDNDSRKIFFFLCINLLFTFVELAYGVWTNSLGLISDGFHMLFDCSALVMGLYASVMSRWKATRIYSYGFDRVEVLSGFINGLFLVVIAFFVFSAAVLRLFDPPEINTERLLIVSVLGFFVNLIGIFSFTHGHSHGGGSSHCPSKKGHGHSHGGSSHGHSHGGSSHGHSYGGSSHGHSHGGSKSGNHGHEVHVDHSHAAHNTNMEGVYLHVLADTMGSVGVIVSTLLIENFDLRIADPICSIFIAVLIFLSVLPLVKETAATLLLSFPEDVEESITCALKKVLSLEGVLRYKNEHIWRHSSKCLAATLHVQIKPSISESVIVSQVTAIFKEAGVNNLTIQVEKEAFYNHVAGFGTRQTYGNHWNENFQSTNFHLMNVYNKGL